MLPLTLHACFRYNPRAEGHLGMVKGDQISQWNFVDAAGKWAFVRLWSRATPLPSNRVSLSLARSLCRVATSKQAKKESFLCRYAQA